MPETEPALLADAMRHGLARWLRVAGCDTTEDRREDNPELVRRARTESRVPRTRDRALVRDLYPQRVKRTSHCTRCANG